MRADRRTTAACASVGDHHPLQAGLGVRVARAHRLEGVGDRPGEEEILSGLDERTNLIDLTPKAFETVIRDLFQVVGGKYIIQAKRFIHRVPVEDVRDLAGALDHERASKGILVTTSDFTRADYQFAAGKPIE
jgi:hypothetical protein